MTIETVEQLREFVEALAGYIKSCNQELEHEEYLSNNRFATRNGLKMAQALTFALGEIENRVSKELYEDLVQCYEEKQAELDRIKNVDVESIAGTALYGFDCNKDHEAMLAAQAVKDFIIKGE